tara:strand:+ start:498 stop:641 length:144 start_codon:yes stop_codon:yes gene_type:complete
MYKANSFIINFIYVNNLPKKMGCRVAVYDNPWAGWFYGGDKSIFKNW